MKRCSMCKKVKNLEDFNKKRMNSDGLQKTCRSCMNQYNRETNKHHNPLNMYVDGKYISRKHPLHKPGRYKTFGEPWSDVELKRRTKTGYVYVMYNPNFEGWFKVGCAVDAQDRLNSYQTSSPYRDYSLAHSEYFEDREAAEKLVHKLLKQHPQLIEYYHEWFMIDPYQIVKIIKQVRIESETNGIGHRDQQQPQYNLALCD